MSYDKDWEVYLALNDPEDPIHEIIDKQQESKTGSKQTWEGMTREEFMRPARQGGMSLGEGRVIEPTAEFQGTMFEGCPKAENPWGKHRFVSYANLNSVEYFECSYGCGAKFSD